MSGSTNGPGPEPRVRTPVQVHSLDPPAARLPVTTADGPQARIVDRLAADVVLRHARGRRVLDLGRGAPELADWVRPRAASLGIVDAVDLGRGSELSLSMPDGSYDLVYCLRTLAHLGRDEESSIAAAEALLREVGRVLVADGVALVGIDNPRSLWGLYHGVRNPASAVDPGAWVVPSDRGITRFDTPHRLAKMLPDTLDYVGLHGLGVISVLPGLLRVPIVSAVAERFEWYARDRAGLRGFAAHLLVVLRRRSRA